MSLGVGGPDPLRVRVCPQAHGPGSSVAVGGHRKRKRRWRRECLFCSHDTIERKQLLTSKNRSNGLEEPFVKRNPSHEGLLCGKCNKFACKLCLLAFDKSFTQAMLDNDVWCQHVRRYVSSTSQTVPKIETIPVGHCCYLKEMESVTEQRNQNNAKRKPFLEGHLLLYEYGVVVDPAIGGCCDVHGFGNDKEHNLKGIHHAVVDEQLSYVISPTDKSLDGSRTCLENYQPPTAITIPGLGKNSNAKTVLVQWFVLRQTRTFPKDRLGDTIRQQDLTGCATGFFDSKEAPLQLLIGKTEVGGCHHLLNARWHDVPSISKMSRSDQQNLFRDCKQKLKRGGFEAHRKNAGGVPILNSQFKQFLRHPGNLPRKLMGVKVLKREKDWEFLYITTRKATGCDSLVEDTRKVSTWRYTQPQVGGTFDLPLDLFPKYDFLYDFVRCKIETALVLQVLNMEYGFRIQPCAVANLLHQLQKARCLFPNDELAILKHVSTLNKYTLVAYPVAYHTDTFAKGRGSLENKVCFVNPSMTHMGIGRGGSGNEEFVYALLDWDERYYLSIDCYVFRLCN
jgi:hypothetical protein